NSGEEYVYFGGFQAIKVPVLDTANDTLVDTLVVGQINPNPPPPSQTTHSVAADGETNLIFVPVSNVGVKVYTARRRSIDADDEKIVHRKMRRSRSNRPDRDACATRAVRTVDAGRISTLPPIKVASLAGCRLRLEAGDYSLSLRSVFWHGVKEVVKHCSVQYTIIAIQQ